MKYLSDYTQKAISAALDKHKAFFAFGKSQFEEKRDKSTTYLSLGGGLICPKDNAKQLIKDLDEAYEAGIKSDVAENGAKSIIRREYFNYESQLTNDVTNAKEALTAYYNLFPELFMESIMSEVFTQCFEDAVENDWF